MNQKKAKALRKAVRTAFHKDPAAVELDQRFKRTIRDDYKKVIGFFEQRVLHRHCGRAMYQRLKKAVRTGVLVPDRIEMPRAVRAAELAMEHHAA
jgi:hypothetical protein